MSIENGLSQVVNTIPDVVDRRAENDERARNIMPVADQDFLSERFTRRISVHLSHERYDAALSLLNEAIEHVQKHKRNSESTTEDCLPLLLVEELGMCGIHTIKDCVGRIQDLHRLKPDQKRLINSVCIMQGVQSVSRDGLGLR